jgi:hypothetical protein
MSRRNRLPHHPPSNAGEGQSKEGTTGRHVYIEPGAKIDLVQDLKDEYKSTNKETGEHSRKGLFWTKVAAGLLVITAFFAGWQSYSAKRSADAAIIAANAAHDTLALSERPWVGLMGAGHLNIELAKDQPIKVTVDLQNTGKSPALNESGVGHLSTHPLGTPMPNFDCSKKDASAPIALMPNAIGQVTITTERVGSAGTNLILHDPELQMVQSGRIQLYIYGCIWYDDTFQQPHRTDYCLLYIPSKVSGIPGQFAACPTHNHAD